MILQGNDPYRAASLSLSHRLRRQLWNTVYVLLFRTSPRPFHGWRAFLLRLFGARLGKGVHVYPRAKVWAPWNLELGDHVGIADDTNIYNMALISIGRYSVIPRARICAAGRMTTTVATFNSTPNRSCSESTYGCVPMPLSRWACVLPMAS